MSTFITVFLFTNSKLLEFDDTKDSANLSNYKNDPSKNIAHDITQLTWTRKNVSTHDYQQMEFNATVTPGINSTFLKPNGFLSFKVSITYVFFFSFSPLLHGCNSQMCFV